MCQSQMEVLGTESCLNRGDYFLPDLEITLSQEESTLEFFRAAYWITGILGAFCEPSRRNEEIVDSCER